MTAIGPERIGCYIAEIFSVNALITYLNLQVSVCSGPSSRPGAHRSGGNHFGFWPILLKSPWHGGEGNLSRGLRERKFTCGHPAKLNCAAAQNALAARNSISESRRQNPRLRVFHQYRPKAAVTGLLHEVSSGFEMRDRLEVTSAFRLSSKPVTWGDADEVHAV